MAAGEEKIKVLSVEDKINVIKQSGKEKAYVCREFGLRNSNDMENVF